jgi:uncharacterized iron-regulated membrane protein
MKIFFRRIHLYLSLAAGLIIMITCATGAILVFERELQELFHPARYHVEKTGNRISLDSMASNLKQTVPAARVTGIKVYRDSLRTVEFMYAVKKPGADLQKRKSAEGERLTAFVNPYTGTVLELYNYRDSFFYSVMDLHRWMLSGDAGKMVVGCATFIFLFILLTGLILWWPKTRAILRQRVRIKFDGGWKRLNHDLHIVMGFYSFIFLFILAFTGLAWSFEWFNKGIYKVTGSSMQIVKPPVVKDSAMHLSSVVSLKSRSASLLSLNEVFNIASSQWPDVVFCNIAPPKDSASPYSVSVLPVTAIHESATDMFYIHPHSGELIGSMKWNERNTGQRVRATFKPIHVASIYRIPSKLIGFFVCIMGASFPVTGVIMWLNRTRKKQRFNV